MPDLEIQFASAIPTTRRKRKAKFTPAARTKKTTNSPQRASAGRRPTEGRGRKRQQDATQTQGPIANAFAPRGSPWDPRTDFDRKLTDASPSKARRDSLVPFRTPGLLARGVGCDSALPNVSLPSRIRRQWPIDESANAPAFPTYSGGGRDGLHQSLPLARTFSPGRPSSTAGTRQTS